MADASLLKFGKGNAKLDKKIVTFSLPSGFTCPHASECLSKADRITGKIKDGVNTQFRCFSASQESLYRNVREQRWANFELLKSAIKADGCPVENIAKLILQSIPAKTRFVRIHVAGDFFSQDYFDAWAYVANARPDIVFYAYTKALPYWITRLGFIPANFVLTASYGGRKDELIERHSLRFAKVVYSVDEAEKLNLPIDHDDSHAMKSGSSFALLLHGIQPAGTIAAKALQTLKKEGFNGYSRDSKKKEVPA